MRFCQTITFKERLKNYENVVIIVLWDVKMIGGNKAVFVWSTDGRMWYCYILAVKTIARNVHFPMSVLLSLPSVLSVSVLWVIKMDISGNLSKTTWAKSSQRLFQIRGTESIPLCVYCRVKWSSVTSCAVIMMINKIKWNADVWM